MDVRTEQVITHDMACQLYMHMHIIIYDIHNIYSICI